MISIIVFITEVISQFEMIDSIPLSIVSRYYKNKCQNIYCLYVNN